MTANATAARDYSLHSGERQTATRFSDIRADHRARYEWAARTIGHRPDAVILDAFSGTGYGAQHLAEHTGAPVFALDASAESAAFGREHFAHHRVRHVVAEYPCHIPAGLFDAVTCFESLEHVEDDARFAADLANALTPGGWLFLSVPNEDVIPSSTFRNPFHVRHYTVGDVIERFVDQHGLAIDAWYGQSLEGRLWLADAHERTLLFHLRAPVRRGG